MSGGIALALAIPSVATVPIALLGRWPNLREAVTIGAALALAVTVYSMVPAVLAGEVLSLNLAEPLPGLPIAFEIEPLGMSFACVASLLWVINSIYSIGYMRGNNEAKQTRFYVCFAIALAATMGVAFSANLLTLFIAYEILTISTYPLVAHHENDESKKSGRTYMGLLMSTSLVLLLLAILLTWQFAGTLDFEAGGILQDKVAPGLAGVLLLLYIYGIGKAALMPVHRWLPAAMVAPTPVSALLHAVAVVKAGVFTVVKIVVYTFGIDFLAGLPAADIVLWLAGGTIILASIIALRQDNLKRRLAYSTISQLSYVIMAAFILAPLSVAGAALHIVAHAFGKITLFFAAGSIYTAAHKTNISQLDGIGRRMPWTMGAFAIGALSMIGVPPAAGFLSKWYMLLGALEVEQWFAVGVIVLSTLLNAAYYLPIVYAAFVKPPAGESNPHPHGEAPLPIVIALTATAFLTLLLFFVPGPAIEFATMLVGG